MRQTKHDSHRSDCPSVGACHQIIISAPVLTLSDNWYLERETFPILFTSIQISSVHVKAGIVALTHWQSGIDPVSPYSLKGEIRG